MNKASDVPSEDCGFKSRRRCKGRFFEFGKLIQTASNLLNHVLLSTASHKCQRSQRDKLWAAERLRMQTRSASLSDFKFAIQQKHRNEAARADMDCRNYNNTVTQTTNITNKRICCCRLSNANDGDALASAWGVQKLIQTLHLITKSRCSIPTNRKKGRRACRQPRSRNTIIFLDREN